MNYTYPPEEYRKQLDRYIELETLSFSPEDDRSYVIEKLEQRSAKKRVIADIANTMIREYIETFERNPESMTSDDARRLEAFHASLHPGEGSYKGQATDPGIAFRIAKILRGYYRGIDDPDKYATALERCTFWESCLINLHTFEPAASAYYEECLELVSRLDRLGDEGRQRALVALSRMVYTGKDSFRDGFPFERYITIRDILISGLPQPLTEYNEQLLLVMYGNMLDYFRAYCIFARDHGIIPELEPFRPFLEDISGYIREHVEQGRLFGFDPIQCKHYLLTADYFLGRITLDGLLGRLSAMQQEAAQAADPIVQSAGLAALSHVYLTILYKFSALPKEEIVRLSWDRIHQVMPRLLSVTRQVNNTLFNKYIVMFLNAASLTGYFDQFAEVILETTVYADKPLFIHTAMVREMSLAIFDCMIGQDPGFFDGVAGHDAEYISAHKDEMRTLLSDCCMFHDIGKFFLLDIVENSMRQLTDDEFMLIKEHPENFEHIYQMNEVADERVLCIRDCALTHHLWHDSTRGYPDVQQTKNRPFADILAIADSIDAATDFLGRPYNSGKTIDTLIAEIQAGAGSQYGAQAAAALSDHKVRERLRYLITEGRREIYYRIYAFNKL